MLQQDEYYDHDVCGDLDFTCNHPDHWESSDISLANLRETDFRGMTGTGCELRFLQFVIASATYLQSVTVSFNLYFIKEEVQDSRMHYFLHKLLGDGTWTSRENEDQDFDKLHKCTKFYKWTPSP
jgi:hypothetical protein